MKLLLYCTKSKPYLYDQIGIRNILDKKYKTVNIKQFNGLNSLLLNGKIVAECDFKVEEIKQNVSSVVEQWYPKELLDESCLNAFELNDYLGNKMGYAIHIKNLHIYNKPKRLNEYTVYTRIANYIKEKRYTMQMLNKAPQNMCYVWDEHNIKYALISIRPEWLCKILNDEKTIEVRKKVLKEMVK